MDMNMRRNKSLFSYITKVLVVPVPNKHTNQLYHQHTKSDPNCATRSVSTTRSNSQTVRNASSQHSISSEDVWELEAWAKSSLSLAKHELYVRFRRCFGSGGRPAPTAHSGACPPRRLGSPRTPRRCGCWRGRRSTTHRPPWDPGNRWRCLSARRQRAAWSCGDTSASSACSRRPRCTARGRGTAPQSPRVGPAGRSRGGIRRRDSRC